VTVQTTPDDDGPFYLVNEAEAAAVADQTAADARALAGVWNDLDWAESVAELERIRHESRPTPPIDEP
jgi:hypothetical protein